MSGASTVSSTPQEGSSSARPAAWGAVCAMALCSFGLVSFEFMPVSLLSPIAADLRLSEGEAGQAISVCAMAALVTSLTVSSLIGSFDRRHVLLTLTSLMIVSGGIVAAAPTFPVLLLGRALVGIALGGFWSLSAATAMRLVPAAGVPKALAIVNAGPALASTVAAPLGSFMGGLLGWRGAFFAFIPLAIAALVWLACALPSLPAQHRGRHGGMFDLLRKPGVAKGYLGALVFFAGQFWLFTYLRPFLEQVTHVGVALLSGLLLIVGVAGFAGTALIGRAIGERLHLTLASLAAVLALTAASLALAGSHALPTAVLLAIWGFASTAAPVVWWTWVTRATPGNAEAGGGLLVAVAQIGIASGAVGGGMLYDGSGPVATFLGSALILFLASLAALAMRHGRHTDRCAQNGVCTNGAAVAR